MRSWMLSEDRITIRFPPTDWGTSQLSGSQAQILAITEPFDDGAYTRHITDDNTAVQDI